MPTKLLFEVTRQFTKGNEQLRASFVEEKDAKEFLQNKLAWDKRTLVQTIYRLYQDGELLSETDTIRETSTSTSSGGSDKRNRATITPFANAPRPPVSLPSRGTMDKIEEDE